MHIYQTNVLGLWDGTVREARPDPLVEGRYLIPAGCVTDEPPTLEPNQGARYADGAWHVVADWRGHVYWTADRVRHEITELDVAPPADALGADPGPTAAELWAAHQAEAQTALDASDMVALRCFKAGVNFPGEWLTYVNALRAVVRASTGDPTQPLPSKPEYPAGT